MNEINGVHVSNLSQTKLEETLKQEKEENETGIFESIADSMEENEDGVLSNLNDALLAEKIKDAAPELLGDNKIVLDDNVTVLRKKFDEDTITMLKEKYGDSVIEKLLNDDNISDKLKAIIHDYENFDVEEAHVYAKGEAEIEKEVEKRMLLQMTKSAIAFNPKSREEIEAEVRAEYAEKHPEYAAVQAEGQRVEAKYEEAKAEEMSNWEKENPKPQRSKLGFIFGGVLSEIKYQLELKEWEKAKAKHEKSFQNDYAKENKNYANLKEQQEAQEPKKKLHLGANVLGAGGGWLGGILVGGPLGGIIGGVAGAVGSEKLADYKDSKNI